MCFAITFVKLDGFWTNLADCFSNKFFIKQCKQMSPEPSTSFVLSAETWKSLIQQLRTCTPCTRHHPAATTWNPRFHWTRCLASEFTRPRSSWLGSGGWYKKASIRQQFETSMIWSSIWAELKQSVVDKAIEQWRPRLRACIRAKGHHFEQLLNWTLHFLV